MHFLSCIFILLFAHASACCIYGVCHFIPYCIGSSWVIFIHLQLFHFASSFTPYAGVCTLLVHPFHASAVLFPFLLGTTSLFHNAWEDGLVPLVTIIATVVAGCCGPFGTGYGFFAKDVRSQPGRQMLWVKIPLGFIGGLWSVDVALPVAGWCYMATS
eukprot:Gb_04923 [translate_table: standard]